MTIGDDDVGFQLAVFGWAVGRGQRGDYPTIGARYYAEREVGVLEGVAIEGMFDAGAVDLLRAGFTDDNGAIRQPPAAWALVGYGEWQTRTEEGTHAEG